MLELTLVRQLCIKNARKELQRHICRYWVTQSGLCIRHFYFVPGIFETSGNTLPKQCAFPQETNLFHPRLFLSCCYCIAGAGRVVTAHAHMLHHSPSASRTALKSQPPGTQVVKRFCSALLLSRDHYHSDVPPYKILEPCHGSVSKSPACHRGGPGLILGQLGFVVDTVALRQDCTECFAFHLSRSFHHCSILIHLCISSAV